MLRLAPKLAPTLLLAASLAPTVAQGQIVQQVYPVGTGFTYQGRLDDNGQPASGVYDLQFQLFNGPSLLNFVQSTIVVEDVQVTGGLFTAKVDFGGLFPGAARWIAIGVRPGNSTGAFTTLPGRQELTPSPYAIGLSLPYAASYATPTGSLFSIAQTGAGNALALSSTTGDALVISTTGGDAIETSTTTGNGLNAVSSGAAAAVRAANSGTGPGLYAQLSGPSAAGAAAVFGYNLATNGAAAFFRTESQSNPANTVEVQNQGTGIGLHVTQRTNRAALFESTSPAGVNGGVMSTVAGGGIPIWAKTTGTSAAGRFDIDNAASTANALEVNNLGSGLTAKFNGGNVQVNGNLFAQTGTVLNRATPIAWGTFNALTQNPAIETSSGNVTITYTSGWGYRVQVIGEGDPSKWTVIANPRYGNNPETTSTEYNVKVGAPLSVAGQPGTGVFFISERCIAGCNEFVPNHWINFVVYKGQ